MTELKVREVVGGELRRCTKCCSEKPLTIEFWTFPKGKPRSRCKACLRILSATYYHANRENCRAIARRSRERNIEKSRLRERISARKRREKYPEEIKAAVRAAGRKYRDNNREKARQLSREGTRRYRERNRDKLRQRQRELRQDNPDRFRAKDKKYNSKRYSTPKGCLIARVNTRIREGLFRRGIVKTLPKRLLTGWTIDDLIAHLEQLFEPEMTIQNHGEWELDHIIPLAAFTFESETDERFKSAWALQNLAPLWAFDNAQKGARTDWTLPKRYSNPRLRAMYLNAERNWKT